MRCMKVVVENKTGRALNADAVADPKTKTVTVRVSVRPCDHSGAVRPFVLAGLLSQNHPKEIFCFPGWSLLSWCPWCGAIQLKEQEGEERRLWVEPHNDVAKAIAERDTVAMLPGGPGSHSA